MVSKFELLSIAIDSSLFHLPKGYSETIAFRHSYSNSYFITACGASAVILSMKLIARD